jgi:hypothetical protein
MRCLGVSVGAISVRERKAMAQKKKLQVFVSSTYTVLVEAVTSFFQGHQPDLSWINAEVSTSAHPR